MKEHLPDTWAVTRIGALLELKYGKGLPQDKRHSGGAVRVYGSNGVVGMHDRAITKGPTIILGRKGSVGEINFARDPVWPIDTTYYIDEFPADSPPNYWTLCLKSLRLGQQEKSSAIPGISRVDIYEVEVPLPPSNEQRRIVAKLEKVMAKVDACQKRLEKIPLILKRFRQSILSAACSGRFTADWRESNPDVEPAPELILRINATRAARKPPSGKVESGTKPLCVQFLREPDHPDGMLPDTWIWVRFGTVIGELRNGVSLRPNIEPPGVPILRISAARPGAVDLADVRYMPKGKTFLPQYALRNSDLLFTRYNGTIELLGVCGMVRGLGKENILYPDKLMRVRFDHVFVLPAFVEIFFQAAEVRERVLAKSKSSAGQNGVSGSDIKIQPFALAPLAEQHEIVHRVEALFALADQIESRYQKAKAHVDKLTQSILAKAFRGELVSQDPNDEPASKLLERIRSETTEKRPRTCKKV